MATSLNGPILALDIGDTSIAGGMITTDGQIFSARNISTMAQQGGEAMIQRVISLGEEIRQENPGISPRAISAGSIGLINARTGAVMFAPAALPGWQNVPVRDRLEQAFRAPAFVSNIGQAMALGEAMFGAGRGYRRVAGLTVGANICGGIVVDGRICYGADGAAGAIGHVVIDYQERRRCSCGRYGCLEAYASAPVVIADFLRVMGRNRVRLELNRKRRQVGIEELADQARLGQMEAVAAVERGAQFLGVGLATVVNLLNPDVIVIGGSVTQLGELYFSFVRQVMRARALPGPTEIPVVPAALGARAVLLGAACLAGQQLENGAANE